MAMEQYSRFARAADWFVIGSGLLSVLGWTLALLQQLKPAPYVAGLGVLAAILVWMRFRRGKSGRSWRSEFSRIKRRLRRPIFVVYAIVWVGALFGGAVYAPSNYDALSYRIPQLLHWVAEGGWHWIDAANSRMNIAPPGMNWLIAPFYFLTKSDRLWFVINLAAFTFLPGCLFELFRRVGASPRTTWWFMWTIPCGYAFALQAGSLGNDLLGATYVVAGIALALRARATCRAADVWISGIAIAMATGVKPLNLPLLIPWAVAVLPVFKLLAARPESPRPLKRFGISRRSAVAAAGTLAVATFSSCLPTALLNIRQTGNWTGDPTDKHRVHQPSAAVGFASNAVMLAVATTQPPLLTSPATWNQHLESWLKRTPLDALCRLAPRFEIRWGELPTEEMANLGPGVIVMSGICLLSTFRKQRKFTLQPFPRFAWAVALAAWASFLLFLARFSSEAVGRLTTSFVPVLILPLLLIARSTNLFRRKWNRGIAVICAALTVPALVLSPARPLFPWTKVLPTAIESQPAVSALNRMQRVYSVYCQRADAFASLRRFIPSSTRTIWMISFGDEPETSLWRPYGSHAVRHLISGPPFIAPDSILVASDQILTERYGVSASAFATSHGLQISGSAKIVLRASGSSELWYVFAPTQP
jgi:hypothetical protein